MLISVYYTKMKGIWDEYNTYSQILPCTCGVAKAVAIEKENEKFHQFLIGLNEKYSVVHSQILNTNPLPSLAQVYARVSQEERQQWVTTSKGTTVAEVVTFVMSRSSPKPTSSPTL